MSARAEPEARRLQPHPRYRADRLRMILDLVGADSTAAVADLAETLGVSAATIRRDLSQLAQHGLVVRSHGGALRAELALRPNIRLVMTGGIARSASFELSGPVAERTIQEYNIDVAFVGVDGFDPVAG